MDATQTFDAYLIIFMLLAFIIMLGAIAGIIDAYLDPAGDVEHDKAEQARSVGGVEL